MSEQEVEELMLRYARMNVALDSRMLGVEFDRDHGVWVGAVSTRSGSIRLVADQPNGHWEVWRYQGSLPKSNSKRMI